MVSWFLIFKVVPVSTSVVLRQRCFVSLDKWLEAVSYIDILLDDSHQVICLIGTHLQVIEVASKLAGAVGNRVHILFSVVLAEQGRETARTRVLLNLLILLFNFPEVFKHLSNLVFIRRYPLLEKKKRT